MDKIPPEKQEQLVSFWRDGSLQAMQTAEEIFQKTSQFAMVLFNLHLAIEKALKSKIVELNSEYAPYSHNLVYLVSKIKLSPSQQILENLARISEYNLTTRYPEDKAALRELADKSLAEKEFKNTQEILTWIFSQ